MQQQQKLEMSETLDQLTATTERLARLEDGSQDRIDQKDLTEAREQLDEVMRHDLQLDAAHSELQNRQRQIRASRTRANRACTSRRAELKTDQEKLKQDSERLEERQQRQQESSAALDEFRQAATDAEAAVAAATKSEARWRRTLDRITRSAELNDLLRQQSAVEEAQERLTDARQTGRADQGHGRIVATDPPSHGRGRTGKCAAQRCGNARHL